MALNKLGSISVDGFLREHWQRSPLLIRNAIPGFESPLSPQELAGLAHEEDVESRIVLEKGGKAPWELRLGPFTEQDFRQLPETQWTLLVQAVDQWVPEVTELLDEFRFIPNWRLDDVMVSYATEGGSVGPHFDHYDVFLLQGLGKRRWKIGPKCAHDAPHLPDTDLHILRDFEVMEEYVLEPGDMLYIPPQFAHWGLGQGDDCMTYSIGFRAPGHGEILAHFAEEAIGWTNDSLRYTDPSPTMPDNPGEIPKSTIDSLQQLLVRYLGDNTRLAQWFGEFMTVPKYPEQDLKPEIIYTAPLLHEKMLESADLYRHPASRFAFFGADPVILFVDGESFEATRELAETLCEKQVYHCNQVTEWIQDENILQLFLALLNRGNLYFDE